jgi:hypothetical protein
VNFGFALGANGILDAAVFWFFVVAWIAVLGWLVFVVLPRAFREARRIVTRLIRLATELPLTDELAKAEVDSRRITRALERVAPLQRRAEIALTTIRTTPLVPPAIGDVVRRVRAEVRAFRQALR